MNELADPKEERLYQRVTGILGDAHGRVVRTVNTEMVSAYWRIGREIVEVEQSGKDRANYGAAVMARLATRLRLSGVRGLSHTNLKQMRQFFMAFSEGSAALKLLNSQGNIGQTVSDQSGAARFHPSLGWTHYCALMRVLNLEARSFYEIEAARESWSVRQLERQIESMLFERLALKGDSAKLANEGQQISQPRDVLKDPFVLEFLGIAERTSTKERELEGLIIERLEEFLLELGKGFCFVGRQKRVTLEGDHFYVDLVFYNRILRNFVLVDLKLGKLTHQDLGQMQMYVNFFDRFQRLEGESPTIGIVLCSEKNEAMVRITLPEDNEQILTARYQQCLPTEAELRDRVNRDREDAERALLSDKEDPDTHSGP